jgi:hypothetical protein
MRIDLDVVVAGVAAGWGSALLFRWVSARVPKVDFWFPAANLARSLVADADNENFLVQYAELLKLLARYLGRQVLTMALPIGAVAAIAMLVLPALPARSLPRPDPHDSLPSLETDRDHPEILLVTRTESAVPENKSERATPQLLSGPLEDLRTLPRELTQTDVTFFLFLCVGYGVGAIVPLRKK